MNTTPLKSNRKQDSKKERNMMPLLNNIYTENGIRFNRKLDKKNQLKGIDLYMIADGKRMVVDEKAATSMTNSYKYLKTFSFELWSNNNIDGIGWLYNKNLDTTHYALIYAESYDDFNTMKNTEIIIIKKDVIVKLLDSVGIHSPKDAMNLLNAKGKPDFKGRPCYIINDNVKLMRSNQLYECPTNAIVSRNFLREHAEKVIVVENAKTAA